MAWRDTEAPTKVKLLASVRDDDDDPSLATATSNEPNRSASFGSSVVNLVNTIIGSGVLALPFAFKLTGVIIGNIFLLMVAALSVLSVNLLLMAERGAYQPGVVSSYSNLAKLALGRVGRIITDVACVLNCFGAMTSYLIILADLIEPIVHRIANRDSETLEVRRVYVVSAALIILLPLSAMRKMDALSFTSALAMTSIVYLVGVIIFEGSSNIRLGGTSDLTMARLSTDFLQTIPIICYAFGAHLNVLPVFSELRNPSYQKYKNVSGVTHLVCYVAYAIVGTFGYFGFNDDTKDNILNNDFDMNNVAVLIARGGICITVLFSFPVLCYPALATIEGFFFEGKPWNTFRHWMIMIPLIGLEALIAILVENIGLLFALTGAVASTTICFILPALFFIKLARAPDDTKGMKAIAWAMAIIGVMFMISSTVITLTSQSAKNPTVAPTDSPTATPTGIPSMIPTILETLVPTDPPLF